MTDSSRAAERVIIAGAGYAGLHVALRLAVHPDLTRRVPVTLVDQHDYHQVMTELPRVAAGTHAAHDARLPLAQLLQERIEFVLARVTGLSLTRRLQTEERRRDRRWRIRVGWRSESARPRGWLGLASRT